MPPSRVPLLFGTMTIGAPGKNGTRNDTLEEAQTIIDTFLDANYREIDTARMYAEGTTEDVLPYITQRRRVLNESVSVLVQAQLEGCFHRHQSFSGQTRRSFPREASSYFQNLPCYTLAQKGQSSISACSRSSNTVRRHATGDQ